MASIKNNVSDTRLTFKNQINRNNTLIIEVGLCIKGRKRS